MAFDSILTKIINEITHENINNSLLFCSLKAIADKIDKISPAIIFENDRYIAITIDKIPIQKSR